GQRAAIGLGGEEVDGVRQADELLLVGGPPRGHRGRDRGDQGVEDEEPEEDRRGRGGERGVSGGERRRYGAAGALPRLHRGRLRGGGAHWPGVNHSLRPSWTSCATCAGSLSPRNSSWTPAPTRSVPVGSP